jgi:WD40-like Beta Propeller Repeat
MRPLLLMMPLLATAACDNGPPAAPMYFERVIQPILTTSCVRGSGQGGCHVDDGTGNALGNLDLTSYAGVTRRRDVLRAYGSYPLPLLLLKASGANVPPIPYQGGSSGTTEFLPSQIQHAGNTTIDVQSNAFFELQKWLANGATENGSVAEKPQQTGTGACNPNFMNVRPDVVAQLGTVDTSSQAFRDFANNVEPVLTQSCAFATCHSAEQSDFFITCRGSGSDDATKFNFLEAQAFVGNPPETSMILLKPLAPSAGGVGHTGGVFFANQSDATWNAFKSWATEAGISSLLTNLSPGEQFFNDHVMPVLLQRGCALEGCHSPGAPNDFKLRAGSQGFFSAFSLAANYHAARHDFLVAEVPDVRHSRLVRKPITAMNGGMIHRGGPPLESAGDPPGLDPSLCPQPWTTASTAFCTVVEWHRLEREALITANQADAMNPGGALPLVWVDRPPTSDRLIDFDTYQPGADLRVGQFTLGALAAVDPASAVDQGSLLANCPGTAGARDVRHPTAHYDGTRVAFAMRTGSSDSLDIYEVTLDAAHTCTNVTNSSGATGNGLIIHNTDPMYAPDGSIVFASTRGRPGTGPTRSLKYLLPQTDLWRLPRTGSSGFGPPEQMTALLGSELSPAMMLNGQVTFTAEKASADFYQLSGRRINWDLTDYHPLLAQRSQSRGVDGMMRPSVNYQQATEIREALDRNFLIVLSDDGTFGAGGTLATFNRSVGPFESDRNEITFLRSMVVLDPAATGRAGASQGAYRSPYPLPDGKVLVSYAPGALDLSQKTPVRYDLAIVDATSGARQAVPALSGGASSRVEAIVVYRREQRALFKNVTQLVFGGHGMTGDAAHGVVHYPDLPMLATLLGANLRSGRFVDSMRPAHDVVVYQDNPPPMDLGAAMAGQTGSQHVYQARTQLGSARLASDGSAQLQLPAMTPLVLELRDVSGAPIFTMTEEDQLGPGEYISRGVPQSFFNSVCAGCHGSVSGIELDIAANPDALTGASVSLSRDPGARVQVGP